MTGAPAAAGAPPPVVVTSINPFGRLGLQKRCLEAWAALGFAVRTANNAAEAERLVAAGLSAEAILPVREGDTGAAIHGKPIPRIAPLLKRMEAEFPGRAVVLVNSDIYPATREGEVLRLWLAQAPAVALTREDCDLLENHGFSGHAPYRNGLDAFAFRPEGLAALNRELKRFPVAWRMCFGIPGWDFLIGAIVRSAAVGGRIFDGALLLHETHPATYADVSEFVHYIPAMTALGATKGTTAESAAYEFYQTILAECRGAQEQAAAVRAMYYRRVPPPGPASERARLVCLGLAGLAPFVRWNYDFSAMRILADRQLADGEGGPAGEADGGLERVRRFFASGSGLAHAFAEELLAALFLLLLENRQAPPAAAHADPAGHARTLEAALRRAGIDPARRRLALARVFADGLVLENVFNPRLYNVLALSCGNDHERAILARIRSFRDKADHAD